MLTPRQHELIKFIDRKLKLHGISPSFDEMKTAVGLKSKSGVHRLITGLEERGFLRRLPHRARALEIIKLPENMSADFPPTGGFQPNVIDGGFSKDTISKANRKTDENDTISIPLYGKIAAGLPVEALRDQTQCLKVSCDLVGRGDHYALTVEGDSMIEAGISDGDIAIIEHTDDCENGSIVVALLNENEVTLKRIRKKGKSIALEPANKNYETRIFGPDQVSIQGRLKAIMRKY
ncbi:MAG: repressor LexA [Rhodospirillaceae bacterium]|nr:repressor LexA [Rhodospirillaceae bacterium]|tara:strand:- start:2671 stop:3375 length:705 start_codon:yes stop_codon:yes gene_type:complete